MNKRVMRKLRGVSKSLYKTGFFRKNFNLRLKTNLRKGNVTLASILSFIKIVEERHVGNYSSILNQLNNYILKISFDQDLDSKERENQYVSVASFSSNLVDKIFLEITELLEKKDYEYAIKHISNFVVLSRGFKDKTLEKSLLKLKKEVKSLDVKSKPSFKEYTLKELISMSDEDKVNQVNLVVRELNSNFDESLVKYLAKVYLSTNKNLYSLDETKNHSLATRIASAKFNKVNDAIVGNITFKNKEYGFNFSLN